MKKSAKTAAIAGIAAVCVGAGTAAAMADPSTSASSAPSASGSASAGAPGVKTAPQHTAVTGTEATKVSDAVKAKYPSATITSVEKDADGSYDVSATVSGKQVRYEVSADLATITQQAQGGGPRGGHGPRGTAVTGTALAQVKAAIKAKDASITVQDVRQDTDGSYHAMGTKSGNRVMITVSKDLKTVTVNTAPAGGPQGHQGQAPGAAPSGSASTQPSAQPSA